MPGPSILRLATEVAAVGELGAFTMSAPLVKRWLPRGDRPVFVMPGFLAGDGSTLPLRRPRSTRPHHLRLGSRTQPRTHARDPRRHRRAHRRTPPEARPDRCRRVESRWHLRSRVGPGCAAHGPTGDHDGQPVPDRDTRRLQRSLPYRALRHLHAPHLEMRVPAYVATTSGADHLDLHRADVSCAGLTASITTPRRARTSRSTAHCGLGFNLAALIVVADRLAQPSIDGSRSGARSLRGLFPAAPTFRVPAEHASG